MFWSKIWFFLIALAAAVALTIALVLPRPAQRTLVRGEATRLATACSVIHILLADDARNRVELAGSFARSPEIMNALDAASGVDNIEDARMKQVRDVGETVMKNIRGARQPDFAMLIDKRGRVVARVRLDDKNFGDIAAGRPLIDDALAGYLRDDLWAQNGTIERYVLDITLKPSRPPHPIFQLQDNRAFQTRCEADLFDHPNRCFPFKFISL